MADEAGDVDWEDMSSSSDDGEAHYHLAEEDSDDAEEDGNAIGMLARLLGVIGGREAMLARLMGHNGSDDDDDEDSEPEEEFEDTGALAAKRPKCAVKLHNSHLAADIAKATGHTAPALRHGSNIQSLILARRQNGLSRPGATRGECIRLKNHFLPSDHAAKLQSRFQEHIFCGVHSGSGDHFMSACQDSALRLYDTRGRDFELKRTVAARDVGWAVVDTSYSPDEHFVIYSSWSNYIHLITVDGDRHEALLLEEAGGRLCPFSIRFSSDSREVICGTNTAQVMVYDCVRDERTVAFDAHVDDINAVCFADSSTNILISGSDDCLAKVWDRRIVNENNPQPVGTMKGHRHGITFLDAKGDGTYFLSQGKDHCIKLWDIRKMSAADTQGHASNHDYRWGGVPVRRARALPGDTSVLTYRGHMIQRTLIRARFSPLHSTGQRFIYSGSANGTVFIYDVLTGKVVDELKVHSSIARDVSWHPHKQSLVSSSWDGTIVESTPKAI
eukprot:m.104511 g.104511  ORF g.104511 m.104511 type:complete len:501 (-) comp15250_c0_seq1:2836-4338(-)